MLVPPRYRILSCGDSSASPRIPSELIPSGRIIALVAVQPVIIVIDFNLLFWGKVGVILLPVISAVIQHHRNPAPELIARPVIIEEVASLCRVDGKENPI
jgi:hypothetical protein